MWILIGYIVNIVINYIIIRDNIRSHKDCDGCNYRLCDRHYNWNDVGVVVFLSIFGPLTLFIVLSIKLKKYIICDTKPPKWL